MLQLAPLIESSIHVIEEVTQEHVSKGTAVLVDGKIGIVLHVSSDYARAQLESGEIVARRLNEITVLSDEELFELLRRRGLRPKKEEPEIKPRTPLSPIGGSMPAPNPIQQAYCRIWGRRFSRIGNPGAVVSIFGGFIEFPATIYNDRVRIPWNGRRWGQGWSTWRNVQVLWMGLDWTEKFQVSIKKRILNGDIEDHIVKELLPGLKIGVYVGLDRSGKKVGQGHLLVAWRKMSVKVGFTVFDEGRGYYSIALPGEPARQVTFWVTGRDITPQIKGAALLAWGERAGIKPQAYRQAPKSRPRACENCHYRVILPQSRSTWDLRSQGTMAPIHYCINPAHVEEAKGPVPIDVWACKVGNDALSKYGRGVGPNSVIWLTPHRRGTPSKLRDDEVKTSCCPLHTFQNKRRKRPTAKSPYTVVLRPHETDLSGLQLVPGKGVILTTFSTDEMGGLVQTNLPIRILKS